MKKIFLILLMTSLFGKDIIAILDLEPSGLNETESKILTQTLTSKIIDLGNYIVVERNDIDKILKEQKFQYSGCTNRECAVEIGQLLNADYALIGNVGKFASTYVINARIIKVETGEIIKSADYTHKGEMDKLLIEGVMSIAYDLLDISSLSDFDLKNKEKKVPTQILEKDASIIGFPWDDLNFEEAKILSQSIDKIIMIDFYADW